MTEAMTGTTVLTERSKDGNEESDNEQSNDCNEKSDNADDDESDNNDDESDDNDDKSDNDDESDVDEEESDVDDEESDNDDESDDDDKTTFFDKTWMDKQTDRHMNYIFLYELTIFQPPDIHLTDYMLFKLFATLDVLINIKTTFDFSISMKNMVFGEISQILT